MKEEGVIVRSLSMRTDRGYRLIVKFIEKRILKYENIKFK